MRRLYSEKSQQYVCVTEHLNIGGLYKPDIQQGNKQADMVNPKMLVAWLSDFSFDAYTFSISDRQKVKSKLQPDCFSSVCPVLMRTTSARVGRLCQRGSRVMLGNCFSFFEGGLYV